MSALRRLFGTSFGSALAGGLVVAVAGWIAIAAGWIEDDSETGPALAPAPLPATPAGDEGNGLTVSEIYERDSAGVAFIRATVERPPSPLEPFGGDSGVSTGSGFVIDEEGRLLTNAHVVAGAERIEVTLGEDDDARVYRARVIGRDPSTDVAVLEVDAPADVLEPLPLGDSGAVEVGDSVIAIGNPFGLDRTVTAGIVSALQREISAPNGFTIRDVIQTDAPINPGNSGGPLIDASGRVIGINSQIESPAGGNVGIGFAVPIDTAREVATELIASGRVEHAFLGVSGTDVTPQIADVLNLSTRSGALVQTVVAGGPADDAGIRGGEAVVSVAGQELRAGGDVIVAVGGEPAASMDDVIAAIDERDPGDELQLELARGDERLTLTVTLGDRSQR